MTADAAPNRPVVAMIHVVPTPYWVHLHHRIAAEFPEIDLRVAYTHDVPDQSWTIDIATDVNATSFGDGRLWQPKRLLQVTLREWRKAARIIRWLRTIDASAVVLGGYSDAGRVRIIASCRRHRLPVFLHGDSNIHGDRISGLKRTVKHAIVSRVVKCCAGVMPFGTAGRQFFLRYGASPDRIFPMPGEPDYAIIESVTPAQIDAVRRRYSLHPRQARIVFSGRLIPLKRVGDLIAAFARIAADRPEWELVIVGDGPLRAELETLATRACPGRVRWCGFVQAPATLAAIYRACDVLVLPSDRDAWALVINEALAAGLAVVVSDVVGAADDLVRDGQNGRVFPPGDIGRLAECLLDTTSVEKLAAYQAASRSILSEWRVKANPVEGLRAALRSVGVVAGVR